MYAWSQLVPGDIVEVAGRPWHSTNLPVVRVWGAGLSIWGVGCRVRDVGWGVQGLGCGGWGAGCCRGHMLRHSMRCSHACAGPVAHSSVWGCPAKPCCPGLLGGQLSRMAV